MEEYMTTIYFVRHAEPNYNNHNDAQRELTPKGLQDRELATDFLSDKNIDVVLSSPFKRSVDTIKPFANNFNLNITLIDDFKERRVDSVWIEDFKAFSINQWNDFTYKYHDGETLGEVQKRNISALHEVLKNYKNKNIVVGSHGTALSTIINYYDNSFGYEDFNKIKALFPWIVKFTFDDNSLVSIDKIDLFGG